MRQLIIFSLFALVCALASANNKEGVSGPYDWNNFLTEVETTVSDIQIKKDKLEKDLSTDQTKRLEQAKDADQMLTRIILIQNMIDHEFKYRDQLDQSQRNILETYKNKALRLRQELTALKQKLEN